MFDRIDRWLPRLRFAAVCLLITASLFALSFLLSVIESNTAHAMNRPTSTLTKEMTDSPNAVTSGMARAFASAEKNTYITARSLNSGLKSVTSGISNGARIAARGTWTGTQAVARGIGRGVVFVGRPVLSGVGFVVSLPVKTVQFVAHSSVVQSIITPPDHTDVPIIDPNSPELQAAIAALPATQPATAPNQPASQPSADAGPIWPMHGRITTYFGVPHRPYQTSHTGMDIADGTRPGTTPIRPFRSGRVVEAVYSRVQLGNHVVVDHGNGVTSVYGHLHTISVHVGQQVTIDSILGTEGSTGVSTGTHLHFEIRVNGQAADPRRFISGTP